MSLRRERGDGENDEDDEEEEEEEEEEETSEPVRSLGFSVEVSTLMASYVGRRSIIFVGSEEGWLDCVC